MRIIFMGTSEAACHSLHKLSESPHEICCVFTQPPRPKGRGMRIGKTPVHELAEKLGLSVHVPTNLNTQEAYDIIQACQADILVVVAYGLLIPPQILEIPRYQGINVHFSLLPRWRGAAPISRAIMAGDKETGISIMRIASVLDAGDIIKQKSMDLNDMHDVNGLEVELSRLGAEALIEALAEIENKGEISSMPQDEALVTYAEKWHSSESLLDWRKPAIELQRLIRASPSGAYFILNGERIKVFSSLIVQGQGEARVGDCSEDWKVVCGDGKLLNLLELQKSGKKRQSKKEFMLGYSSFKGGNLLGK